MYCYFNNGQSVSSVDQSYQAQVGEVLLAYYPPYPGDVPAWDAAQAAAKQSALLLSEQSAAVQKLAKADVSALRALKSGIAIGPAWLAYESALRVVVAQGGCLPANPTLFPDGSAVPQGW